MNAINTNPHQTFATTQGEGGYFQGIFGSSQEAKPVSTLDSPKENIPMEVDSFAPPTLKGLLKPYQELSSEAALNQRLTPLIERLTDNIGTSEPDSEGMAYLLDKGVQYFTKEMKQNYALSQLQEKLNSDRDLIEHLLKSENLSEEDKVGVLNALNRNDLMIKDLTAFNNLKTISKIFAALSFTTGLAAVNVWGPLAIFNSLTIYCGAITLLTSNAVEHSDSTEGVKTKNDVTLNAKGIESNALFERLNAELKD